MHNRTILDYYREKVYRIILIAAASAGAVSAVIFTGACHAGWYTAEDIRPGLLRMFDISCLMYIVLAWIFVKKGYDEQGDLRPAWLKAGKLLLAALTVYQWNFISYMVPSVDFWGFCVLFLLLSAFFLDEKLVAAEAVALLISVAVSWIICKGRLIALKEEHVAANLLLRSVCLVLSMGSVWFITRLCNTMLLREIEKVSDYDPLTHLLNRRHMDDVLKLVHSESTPERPYCAAMIDIDDFKQVNDTYGHEYGDNVLRRLSSILNSSVSKNDWVFRWGGEEFLVIFRSDRENARAVCEKILSDISSETFTPMPGVTVHITITAGIAQSKTGVPIEEIIDEADERLYLGKRSGKARILAE